ncbi:ABC transporter permease [Caldimonas sp.]|uniref:ABC transporter permease n=1 Tax=Caldimonas sp. TaxID=2838790 RepID=UPI00391A3080
MSKYLAFQAQLLFGMVRREILGRYRGSFLGGVWPLLAPILLLSVYTVAFHDLLGARWPGIEGRAGFASMVFAGMLLHGALAEVLSRAPQTIVGQPNFVKKVVFPLAVLPVVPVGVAAFHALLGFFVLAVAAWFVPGEGVRLTALLLPVFLLPYLVMLAGVSWGLAALGVYVRDVSQVVGISSTMLLFLSPIFFPLSALPVEFQPIVALNPLTWVVEGARGLLFDGVLPGLSIMVPYVSVSLSIGVLGAVLFGRLKPGFGDVL